MLWLQPDLPNARQRTTEDIHIQSGETLDGMCIKVEKVQLQLGKTKLSTETSKYFE